MAIAKAMNSKLRDELLNGEIFYTVDRHRKLAASLQHSVSTLIAGIPTTGIRGARLATLKTVAQPRSLSYPNGPLDGAQSGLVLA
jgi:hypothetical protein